MTNKPIIFWDFDGVMADSTDFVFAFWEQEMKKYNITFTLADYQATFTHKLPFEYLAERYGDIVPAVKASYSEYETNHYPKAVKAFPGFKDHFLTITEVFEHHIISSNLKVVITQWLELQGLSSYFKTVIGRETAGYKDQKISKILDTVDRKPAAAIFVGDTISDVEHAQSAGIKSIAVSWGVHSRSQLETVTPDHICDTIPLLFKTLPHAH